MLIDVVSFTTDVILLQMKKAIAITFFLCCIYTVNGQKNIHFSFSNDNKAIYHLSLIIYTPDGKIQTRVSNLTPQEIKSYSLPVNTEIYIADANQEAFAMKGNDIKSTGVKPYIVVKGSDDNRIVKLSSLKLH
jgi:hypothetical protein